MNSKPLKFFALIIAIAISSCSNPANTQKADNQVLTTSEPVSHSIETYSINSEDIFIKDAPGEKSNKIINETATKALGETQYCKVDYSVKVEILEHKDNWTKIKVIEPEWLTGSHIGWIPSKYIVNKEEEEKQSLKSLESEDFEILKTRHNQGIQNFHVLLKRSSFDKNYVYQFVKQFRKGHCAKKCNVYVYDSKTVLPLVDIYSLQNKDYIKLADHFVSLSTFDATEVRDWYPYQDLKYKEYGGKNWKKEPIK